MKERKTKVSTLLSYLGQVLQEDYKTVVASEKQVVALPVVLQM